MIIVINYYLNYLNCYEIIKVGADYGLFGKITTARLMDNETPDKISHFFFRGFYSRDSYFIKN